MDTDLKKIKKILKLLEESNFNEIEWEEADFKIRVKKTPPEPPDQRFFSGIQSIQPDYPKSLPVPQGTQPQETELELAEGRAIIRSPLVGTFYRAPSPNVSAFVNVGDVIKPGQVMCIIEAMKLMNEVECDRAGRVAAILVENAQPVEYGEPLFIIETEGFQ
ncbi:MAG: acetyl-CoA carboxylase biotin carboxyl carrier protein [bacterium]